MPQSRAAQASPDAAILRIFSDPTTRNAHTSADMFSTSQASIPFGGKHHKAVQAAQISEPSSFTFREKPDLHAD
jgi:hypothetical protein